MRKLAWIMFGYLSGSVLYARIFARIFGKTEIYERSKDHNPGAGNAFMYGGFMCGMLTLICDISKGFFPVYLFMHYAHKDCLNTLTAALVIAAPVVGHAFSIFYKGKGGKGIAATFGSLLGLFPYLQPALLLALFFIFFSCVIRINPHYYRTLAAFFSTLLGIILMIKQMVVILGFAVITAVVSTRMFSSGEEKERMRVRLLWMR
ncbi:MAG: glycerol-3-phosphate acyltransferase [Lachnospira sp.]